MKGLRRVIATGIIAFILTGSVSAAVVTYDNRRRSTTPVAVRVVAPVLLYATYASEVSTDISINGTTQQIHFTIPDLNGSHTAELLLYDASENVIYSSGEKAESVSYVINVERPMTQIMTVVIQTSGSQTADRTFAVDLYYR